MKYSIQSDTPAITVDHIASLTKLLELRGIQRRDVLEVSGITVHSIENPSFKMWIEKYG
jgi:hypothetical protein